MKKYKLELETSVWGRIFVVARNKKEAEEKGEKILREFSAPEWWEAGAEGIVKITKYSPKWLSKKQKDIDSDIPYY